MYTGKIKNRKDGKIFKAKISTLKCSDTDYREKFTFQGEVETFKGQLIIKQGEYNG